MKKIIYSICMAWTALSASAQSEEEKVTFGLRAGVNFQNFNGKDENGDNLSNSLVVKYNAGANVEFLLAPDYYLQAGLLFSAKGSKKGSTNYQLNYVELPIYFLFKPQLGSDRILLGLGPYLAYGVGGKVKTNGSSAKINYAGEASAADYYKTFKPFDAGANFLAGYEFNNGLSFQINAQLGLTSISPKASFLPKQPAYKNTGFGLSLGYRF